MAISVRRVSIPLTVRVSAIATDIKKYYDARFETFQYRKR